MRLSRVSTRDGDEDVRGEETVEMGRVENRETVTPRNRETRENKPTGVILPVSYRDAPRDRPFFCHGTTSFDLRHTIFVFLSREGARVEDVSPAVFRRPDFRGRDESARPVPPSPPPFVRVP